MQFSDIIGQPALKEQLSRMIISKKIPHALMFLGNLGHGGLALALASAQMVQCENPTNVDSCGKCTSCIRASKLIHPDIHYSYPFPASININHKDEKIKRAIDLIVYWRQAILNNPYISLHDWMTQFDAENKQANIPIEECHDIIRRLSLKSFESKYKIVIIWLPEYLGNAGNTLLKILEEPPDDTLFFLVAEQAEPILSTILSRTQIMRIKPIESAELAKALSTTHHLNDEEAANIAALSQGNFIEATKIIAQEINNTLLLLNEWLTFWCNQNMNNLLQAPGALVAWIDKFSKTGREDQKNFFHTALYLLQKTLHYQLTGILISTNEHEKQFVLQLAPHISFTRAEMLNKLLNTCHYYLERNAHTKILMMSITLRLCRLFSGMPAEDELTLPE